MKIFLTSKTLEKREAIIIQEYYRKNELNLLLLFSIIPLHNNIKFHFIE